MDPCSEYVIEILETLQINVDDGNICADSYCSLAGICTDRTCSEDDNIALRCARYACQKYAFSSKSLFKIFGTLLYAETAGYLAHWNKKRKTSVSLFECLIGNTRNFSVDQSLGLLRIRCKMEVSIEDQAFVEERILRRKRLFDLDHHFTGIPDILCLLEHRGACRLIFLIRKA